MNKDDSIYKYYKSGEVIIRENEASDGCFILLSGKVGVYKDSTKVAEFDKPGMIFGEISLILDCLRTATVIALEDSNISYIKTDLDTMIIKYPSVVNKILHNLAEELERTTSDLFTSFKLMDIDKLKEIQ